MTGRKKYVLARRFYAMVGRKGEYTRKRGLDRETNKALLLKHIMDNSDKGSPFSELQQVLSNLSANEIRGLLRDLVGGGAIHVSGRTRGAKWYPGPASKEVP